jgi:hypothetical protein
MGTRVNLIFTKSHDKIKELPDKSTDVESDNVLKRYGRRPKQLSDVCLADFIACFNCIRDKDSSFDISNLQDGYLPENDFHENTDDDPHSSDEHLEASVEYQMRGGFKIVKRRKPRILRSIRFHKDKDPENYYREQLMLYYPWRNERKDLLGSSLSYQERYKQVEYIVNINKKNYEHHSNVLDAAVVTYSIKIMRKILNLLLQTPNISMTKILPVRQNQVNYLAVLTQVVVRNIVNATFLMILEFCQGQMMKKNCNRIE